MRMIRPALAAALALGLLAPGCGPTSSAPSQGAALQAERAQSRGLLSELRRRDMLIADRALNRYVDDVTARLDRTRPRGAPSLRTFIVKDPNVNAFTTGAGYVFVTAGLLGALENEAQFAFVVAHEIAHVDLGHVAQGAMNRQRTSALAGLGAVLATAAGLPPELARTGAGIGAQLAVADFSREQETQADERGLRYHARAGWDPVEGAASFEVLRRLYGEARGAAAFLASHPASGDRQARLVRLARAEGVAGGEVGAQRFLGRTAELRRALLGFYRQEGRTAEARQMRRNLNRTR